MKVTKVEYTVDSEFAAKNAENIEKVMKDLRQLNNVDLKYASFVKDDKRSFVHFVMSNSDEAGKILSTLDSFKKFQSELKASSPPIPPKVEDLSLVASSYQLFME